MTTLSAGATVTVTLQYAATIALTLDIPFERVMYSVVISGRLVAQGGVNNNHSLGPYAAGSVVTLTAETTAIEYVIAGYAAIAPAFISSVNGAQLLVGDAGNVVVSQNMILISTAAPVSVTGTTTKTALRTTVIPDGAMGPNSRMVIKPIWGYTSSANTKTLTVDIGTTLGAALTLYTRPRTTTTAEFPLIEIANRNNTSAQLMGYSQSGTYGTGSTGATDTAMVPFAQGGLNVYVSGTLTNTGETITLDSLQINIVNPYS